MLGIRMMLVPLVLALAPARAAAGEAGVAPLPQAAASREVVRVSCCRSRSHSSHSHGGGSHSRSYAPRTYHAPKPRAPKPRAYHPRTPRSYVPRAHHPRATVPHAPGARDRHGRLKRSESAKREFERKTGHPHGWPGHVVDHIVPLACGGTDSPSNMQWQTTEEAKAKDRWERKGCGR